MHIALARKYRPAVFEDMTGQDAIAQALKNAVLTNRVAPAYIFAGPRGVGKTSLARILAKTLNCPHTKEAVPCNTCDICRSIAAGSDLDVVEIDGASHRTVEEVQPIIENIHYPPTRSSHKIYIIDEVHMLSKHAFNSLLKTLEEPPPFALFIFATTEPDKIPETVRSRCQSFDFLPLQEMDILKRLSYVAKSENFKVEPGLLRRIARLAKGSMRDAISLLDQLVAYAGDAPGVEALEHLVGVPSASLLGSLLLSLVQGKTSEVADSLRKALSRNNPEAVADELLFFVRDSLIYALLKRRDALLSFTESEVEPLARLEPASLTTLFANLLEVRNKMRYSAHPSLLLEVALLRLTQRGEVLHIFELLESAKEGKPPSSPLPLKEAQQTQPSFLMNEPAEEAKEQNLLTQKPREESKEQSKRIGLEERGEASPKGIRLESSNWTEIREALAGKVRSQLARNILNGSVLKSVGPTEILLGIHPGYIGGMKDNLQMVQIRRDIEEALRQVTGAVFGVKLVGEESLRRKTNEEGKEGHVGAKLQKNIQQIRQLFQGTVLEEVRDVSQLRRTDETGERDSTEDTETAE
ncbi:MAG: DNA polymerase III subunit gamma/tau [Planctomycetota bacterium]|nr:DNA polymerase III subunit gamma/tau [Planctomycetota bacterium]